MYIDYDDESKWYPTGIYNKNTAIPERLKYISDNSPQQFDDSLRCLMLYPNLHMTQKIKLRSKIPPGANILFNKGLWYWNTGYPDYSDNFKIGEVLKFEKVIVDDLNCIKVTLKVPNQSLIWMVERKSKLVFEVFRDGQWESERNTWEYYDFINSTSFIMRKYGVPEDQKDLLGSKLNSLPARVWEAGQFIKIMEADQSSSAIIIDENNIDSVIAGITYYLERLDYYLNTQRLPSDSYYVKKTKAYIEYYKAVLGKLYIMSGITVNNITQPLGVIYSEAYHNLINAGNIEQMINIVNIKYNELISVRPLSTEEIIFAKLQKVQYFGSTRIYYSTTGNQYTSKVRNTNVPDIFSDFSNYNVVGSTSDDELIGTMSFSGTTINSNVTIDIPKFFNIDPTEVNKYSFRIQVSFGSLRNALSSPEANNIYFYNTLSATKPTAKGKSTVRLYINRLNNTSLPELLCCATISLFATRISDFENI